MNIEKAFKALIQIYLVTIIAVFVGAFNESTEVNQINENIVNYSKNVTNFVLARNQRIQNYEFKC